MLGPSGKIKPKITPALSDLLLDQQRYQSNLTLWDQFLIWCYTLDSGPVNNRLVGLNGDIVIWALATFKAYNVKHYGLNQIGYPYRQWQQFFSQPNSYLALSKAEQNQIADTMLEFYIADLERLIVAAPATTGEIVVYKATRSYPELEQVINQFGMGKGKGKLTSLAMKQANPITLSQKPFNSTTYDPELEFSPFLGTKEQCCLMIIRIPPCARVLAISPLLHAYQYEREILLPFGTDFDIFDVQKQNFNYIPGDEQKVVQLQSEPYVIGEVFRLQLNRQHVQTKAMRIIYADVTTPYNGCE